MKRHYAVLQKKLSELESQVRELLFHSPTEEIPTELLCDEINGRIGFLKTLLSAEMESQAINTPDHLHHIAESLSTIEDAFQNWITFGTSPDNGFDALSTCSCTYSCLNEAEEDEKEEDNALSSCWCTHSCLNKSGEEEQKVCSTLDPAKDVEVWHSHRIVGEKTKQRQFSSRKCSIIGLAMILAVALIGIGKKLYMVEEKVFLVPT